MATFACSLASSEKFMRDKQAFKIGFLRKLAALGLTPADISAAMEKSGGIGSAAKGILSTGGQGAKALFDMMKSLGMLTLGAGAVGGAGAGMLARTATRADDEDVEDVKTNELANEYRRLAKEVRERSTRSRQGALYGRHWRP